MKTVLVFSCLWLLSVLSLTADPFELQLWPGGAPGSENSKLEETVRITQVEINGRQAESRWIQGTKDPSITLFLPEETKANGAAVLVCPGGGFNGMEFDKEGTEIALWLQAHGIAGVVLKYRLPDEASGIYVRNGALLDAQRAIRLMRYQGHEWGIDPQRIGVTGFSAGGYLTSAVGTLSDPGNPDADDPIDAMSCRPNFIAPIYPLVSLRALSEAQIRVLNKVVGPEPTEALIRAYSIDEQVTEVNPPTFIVQAHDDYLSTENSIRLYSALKKANVSVEMHIFSRGGHGFGMRTDRPGTVASKWPELWLEWMEDSGFLASKMD
jgi:acetyl esterase/lipase